MSDQQPDERLIHIRPATTWRLLDFRELCEYRDLFLLLVIKHVKVKYKQTVLGGLWAVLQPFVTMVVFNLFFGRLAGLRSDGVPYPIFSYTALVAWTYFASALCASSASLSENSGLVSKVYFPRLAIPLAPVFAGLLDFAIAFVVLIGMMLWFRILPTATLCFIPGLVVIMVLTVSGPGMWLAALNARYRDIRYAVPFVVQLWMFASPIVYSVQLVPPQYRYFYALNPMVGVIEGFRCALLRTDVFPVNLVLVSAAMSVVLFGCGLVYFRRTEAYFADVI